MKCFFYRSFTNMVLFAKYKRSTERILANILSYIENKLKLRANKEKTSVSYIERIKFIVYGLYTSKAGIKTRVHSKSIAKIKTRIKELTAKGNALGYKNLKKKLKEYVTEWANYFKLADIKSILTNTDLWLRRRIIMYIWKRWKKVKTRYEMLRKLGFNHNNARKYSCTRKGYWYIANSQILNCTITDKRLRDAGYSFFLDYYKFVKA
ncbi:group II intron maturase-specific domain-containing protein [Clostridium algidicarnis]|uniref:group II intron maturase-specific domain-containing protein n=1 Tax=Clostridium algidicarnis TaxID=37659 RepID=UPI0016256108|nr:group II intron maturase-specific domain-containing protein [Clostridium algidicarnis]MBB6698590.1 hypothetical protein [Clostridium algidicarnis]